eukprot:359551-Chlamydomonas_euryale.AAC.2
MQEAQTKALACAYRALQGAICLRLLCPGSHRGRYCGQPAGLESVFLAGKLVCGAVSIRKGCNDKAHLVLEGALCDDFYRVREVIYSQYSVC